MTEEQLITIVAEILEVEPTELSMDSSLDDLGWDSLCDIGFIAAVDEEVGKTVIPNELKACSKVSDLWALV